MPPQHAGHRPPESGPSTTARLGAPCLGAVGQGRHVPKPALQASGAVCLAPPPVAPAHGRQAPVPVVQDLHGPVLLYPQLPDNHVVHAAGGVGPGVGLVVSVRGQKTSESEPQSRHCGSEVRAQTDLNHNCLKTCMRETALNSPGQWLFI